MYTGVMNSDKWINSKRTMEHVCGQKRGINNTINKRQQALRKQPGMYEHSTTTIQFNSRENV
jgi:hypothetical protein